MAAETHTYECRCGTTFRHLAGPPPSWGLVDGELLCGDCRALERFDEAGQPGEGTPTPIRLSGRDAATSILLRSGAYLDLADPDCTVIQDEDIAAGLRQPRFAAQSEKLLTIAQHSILVAELVMPVAEDIGGEEGHALAWCALMHDAHEAFLHDVTRPLKSLLPDYRKHEQVFAARFAQAWKIMWTPGRKEMVRRADLKALAVEREALFADRTPWPCLDEISRVHARLDRVWSADEAEARFLEAMARLSPFSIERKAA